MVPVHTGGTVDARTTVVEICVPAAGIHRLIESNHRGGDWCCAGLIRRCSSTLGDRNFILR